MHPNSAMNYYIDIQHASKQTPPVTDELLRSWAMLALAPYRDRAELTLRIVDEEEITHLNNSYRQKNQPTNVLAFPSSYPDDIELEYPLLGDVIICPSVLKQESLSLEKPITAHWAHIVIHGILHLLGYDHIKDEDASMMQSIETQLVTSLGFDDPYGTQHD